MASGGSTYSGNPLDTSPGNEIAMLLGNFGAVPQRQVGPMGYAGGGSVQDGNALLHQANLALYGQHDEALQADLKAHLQSLLRSSTPGFQEGGGIDFEDILKGAAVGVPAAMLSRRPLNMLARPIQRALSKPVMGFESVRNPEHLPFSDQRMQGALERSTNPLSNLPVSKLQGAFMNPEGRLEANPLYAQSLPRTMGRVDKNKDMMKYAGEVGHSLNQWGIPIQRAVPNLFNIPAGADSLLMDKIGPEEIKRLAQAMPNETVVSHRPGNKALLFSSSVTPPDIRDMRKAATQAVPGAGSRYAVSRPGVDRVLIGEEPWMDSTYQELGLK